MARSPPAAWPRRATGSSCLSAGVAGNRQHSRAPAGPVAVGLHTTRSARTAGSTSACSVGWPSPRARPSAVARCIYANISVEADPATFEAGWPPEITYDELFPHYRAVAETMNVQPVPREPVAAREPRSWPRRPTTTGHGDRFRPLELAVTFDTTWSRADPDAKDPARSRRFTNPQGSSRAPASTSANATSAARSSPATRSTSTTSRWPRRTAPTSARCTLVRSIERAEDGYRVHLDRIEGGVLRPSTETARIVVLAAGSLGSTELLLRSRDVTKTLPRPARTLGQGLERNGDFLTIGWHPTRDVRPDRRADDHQRDRLPRRVVGRPPVPDRGRRLSRPAGRVRPRNGPTR